MNTLIADGMVVQNGTVGERVDGIHWNGPAYHLTDLGRLMLSTGRTI